MSTTLKLFSVNLYGSHPDLNNDDCWTGEDFETLAEAQKVMKNPWKFFNKKMFCTSTEYFVLDGKDVHLVQKNPAFKPEKDLDEECRRELAMEAGMLHGCDAYNDIMGYY